MSKVIDITPHLKKEQLSHRPVYAVVTIPAVYNTRAAAKKPGILRMLAWTVDVAVSLGLGALLLVFLLLLIISL